jgi:hypothetical protein
MLRANTVIGICKMCPELGIEQYCALERQRLAQSIEGVASVSCDLLHDIGNHSQVDIHGIIRRAALSGGLQHA